MAHLACEAKQPSVVRSSTHPCPGKWVAIRCAVVYYARAAHAFSAGIKCRHCSLTAWIKRTYSFRPMNKLSDMVFGRTVIMGGKELLKLVLDRAWRYGDLYWESTRPLHKENDVMIYKYDIVEGKLLLVYTPKGCHICFIIPNKIQNTKGGQLHTEILDKYSSSAFLI